MANSEKFESIMYDEDVKSALTELGCPVNEAVYLQAIEDIKSLPLEDIKVLHEQMPNPLNPSATCPTCSNYRWRFCNTCSTNTIIKQTLGMILEEISMSQTGTNDASG